MSITSSVCNKLNVNKVVRTKRDGKAYLNLVNRIIGTLSLSTMGLCSLNDMAFLHRNFAVSSGKTLTINNTRLLASCLVVVCTGMTYINPRCF